MWFCCQLWQCTCLGQFDVWKAWSQVVYPTKTTAPSPSKHFSDQGSSDDVKPSVHLERQDGEGGGDVLNPTPSSEQCGSQAEKQSSLMVMTESPKPMADSYILSGAQKNQVPLFPRGDDMIRRRSDSPHRMVEENEDADDSQDETPSLSRVSSTEWTKLESRLDFWSREHARLSREYEEREPGIRICYNDSRCGDENHDLHLLDPSTDEESTQTKEEKEAMRRQYRRLWELRATLEEDEELAEPNRRTPSLSSPNGLQQQINLYMSSPVQSPETENVFNFNAACEPCIPVSRGKNRLRHWNQSYGQPNQACCKMGLKQNLGRNAERSISPTKAFIRQNSCGIDYTGAIAECSRGSKAHEFREDCGYRSLENPNASVSAFDKLLQEETLETEAIPLTLCDELSSAESLELEYKYSQNVNFYLQHGSGNLFSDNVDSVPLQTDIDTSIHFPPSSNRNQDELSQYNIRTLDTDSSEQDEGFASLQSLPGAVSLAWEKHYRSRSRRHREFGEYYIAAGAAHYEEEISGRCQAIQNTHRDYSVDKKSDALFREFSRYEMGHSEVFPRRYRSNSSHYGSQSRHQVRASSGSVYSCASNEAHVDTASSHEDTTKESPLCSLRQ